MLSHISHLTDILLDVKVVKTIQIKEYIIAVFKNDAGEIPMFKFIYAAVVTALSTSAFADGHAASGNVEAGEQQFNRQCVACHIVANADGEVLAGRNAGVGPNLYGLANRQLGTVENYRYGNAIVELGETGQLWTEEAFVAYVQDPTGWLREALDNNRARGKMAYRVRDPQDAIDIYAYLATFDVAGENAEAESN
jgi:cytochrome c